MLATHDTVRRQRRGEPNRRTAMTHLPTAEAPRSAGGAGGAAGSSEGSEGVIRGAQSVSCRPMQEGPGSDAAPAAGDEERERVATVLDQLRAGVRQRRAELATLGGIGASATGDGGDAELQGKLLQVRQSEYVRE